MPESVNLVFGRNLRVLCEERGSIAENARQMDISRVQLMRYITGQSFPKPAQLRHICTHFGVDARVLLQPLDEIRRPSEKAPEPRPVTHAHFAQLEELARPSVHLPDGFYQFFRPAVHNPNEFVAPLATIRTVNGIRTFSLINPLGPAVRRRNTGLFNVRKNGGLVLSMGNSFVMISSGRHPLFFGVSYFQTKYLTQFGFYPGSYYVMSPSRDPGEAPLLPLLLRPLRNDVGEVLRAARMSSARPIHEVPEPYRRHLLRPGS